MIKLISSIVSTINALAIASVIAVSIFLRAADQDAANQILGTIIVVTVIISSNLNYKERKPNINELIAARKTSYLLRARNVTSFLSISASGPMAFLIFFSNDSVPYRRAGIIFSSAIMLVFLISTNILSFLIRQNQKSIV